MKNPAQKDHRARKNPRAHELWVKAKQERNAEKRAVNGPKEQG